jgi:hypothetical protein
MKILYLDILIVLPEVRLLNDICKKEKVNQLEALFL